MPKQVHVRGHPTILECGHFGNYDVVQANFLRYKMWIVEVFHQINNLYFYVLYIKSISKIGDGLYERGRPSLKMLEFLKGGVLAVSIGQKFRSGAQLISCGIQLLGYF